MPIESECRYLKDAEWSRKAFSGSADGGESAENHAERVAHAAASKDKGCVISTFLFEQNAFPCVKCISWFLDKSLAGATFVFACTANEGFTPRNAGSSRARTVSWKARRRQSAVFSMPPAAGSMRARKKSRSRKLGWTTVLPPIARSTSQRPRPFPRHCATCQRSTSNSYSKNGTKRRSSVVSHSAYPAK